MNKVKKVIREMFSKKRTEDINNITYEKAKQIIKNNPEAILLDVRSVQEYNEGHLDGAINIADYEMRVKSQNILKNKSETIIVYCKSGVRSKKSIKILKKLGYTGLYNLEGGIEGIN